MVLQFDLKLKGFLERHMRLNYDQMRSVFLTTFCIGLLCHLFLLANTMTNHDNLVQLINTMDLASSGRWFQKTAAAISTDFSMPWVNGLLTIFYTSITTVLLADLFQIKGKIFAFLLGAQMVTYPSVGVLMPYMGSHDAYALAALLMVIALRILIRHKWGIIPAIVLCVLSLGIYQGYFGFVAALCLGFLIYHGITQPTFEWKALFRMALRMLLFLGASMAIYLIITKVVFGDQLTTYYGINEMGSLSLRELPGLIANAYGSFFGYYFADPFMYRMPWTVPFLWMTGLLLVAFILTGIFKTKSSSFKKGLLVLFVVLFPLAVNLIYLMSGNEPVGLRMLYGYMAVPVLLLALLERIVHRQPLTWKQPLVLALTTCIVLTLSISVYNSFITTNRAYFKLALDYENIHAYTNRVAMRIEEVPEYHRRRKIVFVGDPVIATEFTEQLNAPDLDEFGLPRYLSRTYSFYLFPSHFLGMNNAIHYYQENEENQTVQNIVKGMPIYPHPESIQFIDNRIFVRFE